MKNRDAHSLLLSAIFALAISLLCPSFIHGKDPGKSFFVISEIHLAYGLADIDDDFSKYFTGLTVIGGYEILNYLNCGFGTGYKLYNKGSAWPVYIDVRYNHMFGKINGFISGDLGLLLKMSDSQNRLFVNPGLGVQHRFTKNLEGTIGTGLFVQFLKNRSHDSFINLKLGIKYSFN